MSNKFELLPCPFCGRMPEVYMGTVRHKTTFDDICIVDDTNYTIEAWQARGTEAFVRMREKQKEEI
jgi:hypothetical protein